MTTRFFTFCVNIGKHSPSVLQRSLLMLIKSMHKFVENYELICYTNFELNKKLLKDYNIKIMNYYDRTEKKIYQDNWLNLNFNRINIYKDLYDEFKVDYAWIDVDTIITADISYVNELTNCFIDNGGNCENVKEPLFQNNNDIMNDPVLN